MTGCSGEHPHHVPTCFLFECISNRLSLPDEVGDRRSLVSAPGRRSDPWRKLRETVFLRERIVIPSPFHHRSDGLCAPADGEAGNIWLTAP
jgi:hypothetical protein